MAYQEVATMYGKKIVLTVVMCLFALCGVQAQTIQNGSKWWDGAVLYTANVQGNSVNMDGEGEHSDRFHFELTKVEGKSGAGACSIFVRMACTSLLYATPTEMLCGR